MSAERIRIRRSQSGSPASLDGIRDTRTDGRNIRVPDSRFFAEAAYPFLKVLLAARCLGVGLDVSGFRTNERSAGGPQ
jgi:hypothetical protein